MDLEYVYFYASLQNEKVTSALFIYLLFCMKNR